MAASGATSGYRSGRFEVKPELRQLLVDGAPVKLGARAFDILAALIERHERIVTKDELMQLVWHGVVVEEGNLQIHIVALRKLPGHDAIATVPGQGYAQSRSPDNSFVPDRQLIYT